MNSLDLSMQLLKPCPRKHHAMRVAATLLERLAIALDCDNVGSGNRPENSMAWRVLKIDIENYTRRGEFNTPQAQEFSNCSIIARPWHRSKISQI